MNKKELKLIYIGGINRSGGSLLARLFDNHKNFVSYPLDQCFPYDNKFFKVQELVAGVPSTVPSNFNDPIKNNDNRYLFGSNSSRSLTPKFSNKKKDPDLYDLLDIPREDLKPEFKWGKEKSDPIGVRKNYLEKSFYDTVKTNFNFDNYIEKFERYNKYSKTLADSYNSKHTAYFESWDNGKNISSETSHVVMQSSNGLYLTNIEDFFKEFQNSRFIIPVRDIYGYVASEKIRLARKYFGARRFAWPQIPWFLIKRFNQYDLNSKIRSWNCSITRARILQEKFGINQKLLVYSNEKLVSDTEKLMKGFALNLGIKFEKILCKPTIGGIDWGGNSHYGKSSGVNYESTKNYKKVLNEKELEVIGKNIKNLMENIMSDDSELIDLTKIPEKSFYDYNYQKKFISSSDKISLYYTIVNSGGRKVLIDKPGYLSIVALLTSMIVRICHIPRFIKQKIFPALGKQNYT